MFCPSCGEKNMDGSPNCAMCGVALPSMQEPAFEDDRFDDFEDRDVRPSASRPRIDNHLVKAILATFFCCLPMGVVALVFASQVDGRVSAGDYSGARKLAGQADTWANFSIGGGLLVMVFYIIMIAAAGM